MHILSHENFSYTKTGHGRIRTTEFSFRTQLPSCVDLLHISDLINT